MNQEKESFAIILSIILILNYKKAQLPKTIKGNLIRK